MINRIIVALVLIPIATILVIFGETSSFIALELCVFLMMLELYKMMENSGIKLNKRSGLTLGLILPAIYYYDFNNEKFLLLSLLISGSTIFFIIKRVLDDNIKESMISISYTLFVIAYIPLLFSHLIAIKGMFSEKIVFLSYNIDKGRAWLFITLVIALGSDASAYFVGKIFGKNPLSPKISPNKTIEGFLGSMLFGIIFSIYIKEKMGTSIISSLTLGFGGSVLGQLGDLGASIFKREFNVKDTGKLLMSHGGILDRCDSILFVAPFVFYFLKFMV
jgi:phosphatidate cytidylyltransferase